MRNLVWISLFSGLLLSNLSATTIDYTVASIGLNEYEYNYTFVGDSFANDQFVTIDFPANEITVPQGSNISLISPATGADFDAWILAGCVGGSCGAGPVGDWQLGIQTIAATSLPETFTVDFSYSGTGTPGVQSFEIFDFNTMTNIENGFTSPGSMDPVPEPANVSLSAIGLLMLAGYWASRRAKRQAAQ